MNPRVAPVRSPIHYEVRDRLQRRPVRLLATIEEYETRLHLPTTDVLLVECEKLVRVLRSRFIDLKQTGRTQWPAQERTES